MTRRSIAAALLAALLCASCAVSTPPVVAPEPPRPVAVVVTSQGQPVSGATVILDNRPDQLTGITNTDGYLLFASVSGSATVQARHIWITHKDHVPIDAHVDLAPGPQTLTYTLTAAQPPPPPYDKRVVRADFCNLRAPDGRVMFTSVLAALPAEVQDSWIAALTADTATHIVVSVESGYPGYAPTQNFYVSGQMPAFLATLDRILAAKNRLGQPITPVVFLHSGDRWPDQGLDYFRGVLGQIPRAYYPRCVWVLAWEAVAGGYTSRQFRDGNRLARDALGPNAILAAHLSPGRLSFSSYPLEPDDPWQGDEMACWKWGASLFDVFLYQSSPFKPGMAFDVTVSESPAERAQEVATRVLGTRVNGAPDWFSGLRRPTLVAFETVAFWQIRGAGDGSYARQVADFFRGLGYQGFGNGLPTK